MVAEETTDVLFDIGVFGVDPTLLVGIRVGVASSLASDKEEPWRDVGLLVGRDVLVGVKFDRIGIDVFVVNVLDGVRRPKLTESDWSESAVEPARDFEEYSREVFVLEGRKLV